MTDERRLSKEHFQLLELWDNIWDPFPVFVMKEMGVKENQVSAFQALVSDQLTVFVTVLFIVIVRRICQWPETLAIP